jgi:DNA invertase Pin-like site-specific DNA recombinase
MIQALCAWLGAVYRVLEKILPGRTKGPIDFTVPITCNVRAVGSRKCRIFPCAFLQVVAVARNATQTAISQAITILSLLVVVGGCLGLLGIVLSTFSAQPNPAPVDAFSPIDVPQSGKTIRYDRRPRRPAMWAIGIRVVAAIVVLAIIWAQIAIHSCYAAAMPPGPTAGRVSTWARRKNPDEEGVPDPMLVGGASDELALKAHQWWLNVAKTAGIDLTGFDHNAPLAERIAWALQAGMEIAAVLSRYSSKLQHSTDAQIQYNVEYAARHRLYTPPEFLCVDEAQKGRRLRRDGLERVKAILKGREATVLLVFKVSRLLRTGYKSFQFVNEEVVEEGLRAISTSQGIDTQDVKTWKALMYMYGMLDDLLLDAIADHCRAGLKTLFQQGYVTGALPVGYRPVEVPGAPPTNRGRPRTIPQAASEVVVLLRQHFCWIRDGMPIKEGWRRWVAANGPCDPRSSLGHMSYQAYLSQREQAKDVQRQVLDEIRECNRLTQRSGYRDYPYEYLGTGSTSGCPLVHFSELPNWDRKTDDFTNPKAARKKIMVLTGIIDDITSPEKGWVRLAEKLHAFFPPRNEFKRSEHVGREVEFYLGFTYDGMRAYGVRLRGNQGSKT